MNVRQIVIGSIIIVLAMIIALVGTVVMQGLSSKHRNAYIVQSAFIALPGFAIGVMGVKMVNVYAFRLLGIILLLAAVSFIGGAVARFVVKYKEIKATKKLIA